MLSDDIFKCGTGQPLSMGKLATIHKLSETQTQGQTNVSE